jgi:hypothetical protein
MTKHSPSPFLVESSPFQGQQGNEIPSFRIHDAEGNPVAETDSGKPEDQQEADARLLATAPDMLDALEAQTEAAQAVIDAWSEGDLAGAVRMLDASLADARAAIAKARGGAA